MRCTWQQTQAISLALHLSPTHSHFLPYSCSLPCLPLLSFIHIKYRCWPYSIGHMLTLATQRFIGHCWPHAVPRPHFCSAPTFHRNGSVNLHILCLFGEMRQVLIEKHATFKASHILHPAPPPSPSCLPASTPLPAVATSDCCSLLRDFVTQKS